MIYAFRYLISMLSEMKKAYACILMHTYICIGIKVFINIGQISLFSSLFLFFQLTYMLVIAIFGYIQSFQQLKVVVGGAVSCRPIGLHLGWRTACCLGQLAYA